MMKAFAVAKWEYLEKIKSKAFLISLFLTPTIMVAVSVLPTLLATRADTESKVIGVIDQSGELVQPLSKAIEEKYKLPNGQPNYILRTIAAGSSGDLAVGKVQADSLVITDVIEGYIVIGKSIATDTLVEYRSQNIGDFKVQERFTSTIRDIVVDKKLRSRGFDPTIVKDLTAQIEMKTIKLSKTGKEEESGFEQVFLSAYGFMMMMFFLVVTSGQLLVRSMLEEKSNRVVEVLMSSCSANDLMAGKIMGLSLLGLTQMAFWVVIGVAISIKFAVTLISLPSALLMLAYFILGYLLYAAIFVAAGSPVSTEQEAQQMNGYLMIILVVPIIFAMSVIQNPNSTLAKVLSFIPLLTPSMMAIRIPIQMPGTLEIVGSLAMVAVSALAAIWIAGKIFRTTILMYGKRPNLRDLLTLIRAH
ncbi:MAG: ABC transporter permease [Ignavibacteria bacterium]|nr:ABC transporter permease [Ignavibacteria bacterium]